MKNRKLIIFLMILLFGANRTGLAVFASQDESKASPDFYFSCVQNNQEFILKARMSYWTGERDVFISGAMVDFYNIIWNDLVLLLPGIVILLKLLIQILRVNCRYVL